MVFPAVTGSGGLLSIPRNPWRLANLRVSWSFPVNTPIKDFSRRLQSGQPARLSSCGRPHIHGDSAVSR